jgi:uncharacterized membrane protein
MIALILAILTASLWGLGYFLEKIAVNHLNPIYIQVISGSLNFLMLPFYYWYLSKYQLLSDYSYKGIITGTIACLIIILGSITFIVSIKEATNLGLITLISACYPIMTVVLSYLFLNEPMNMSKIFACFLFVIAAILFGIS